MKEATQRERIRQYLYRCQFGATRNVIARDTGLMVQHEQSAVARYLSGAL